MGPVSIQEGHKKAKQMNQQVEFSFLFFCFLKDFLFERKTNRKIKIIKQSHKLDNGVYVCANTHTCVHMHTGIHASEDVHEHMCTCIHEGQGTTSGVS